MKKNFLYQFTVIMLIAIAIFFSLLPTLYYLSITPGYAVFPLIHNNHPDYFFYLSLMKQGAEGHWLVNSRFTPELFPPQFVQTFFVLLGHLSRITTIDLPLMYTAARVILGFFVALATFFLITLLDKRKKAHLVGLIFVLFGTSFWLFKENQIYRFMTFWTSFDARERATFLPHHLFGTLGVILSISFLTLFFKSGRKKFLLAACLIGFLATFVNPISMGNFFFAMLIFFPLSFVVHTKRKDFFKKILPGLFLYLAVCAIPFLYLYKVQHSTFPWNTYNPARDMLTFPISVQYYILGLGPTVFFALFGIKELLKRKDFISFIVVSWFLSPFIGIFILSRYFSFGNVFFLYAAHYIPVGILGALGLWTIARKRFFGVLLVVCFILYSAGTWYGSITTDITRWTPGAYNIFLPRDFIAGFHFLNTVTKSESVVLSDTFLSTIIPAYTHNRTVSGHIVNTYNFEQKTKEVEAFFSQTDINFAKNIIKIYRVSYIFFTAYTTGDAGSQFIKDLPLNLVYKNPTVTIYKTNY